MFSLCECSDVQFVFLNVITDVQFVFQLVFQNVSDYSRCSVCVSECVSSLLNVSDVQFVFQNVSDRSRCSVCVSECVRSLSMFSLCFRMCQIALSVQFVFQNVSDHS